MTLQSCMFMRQAVPDFVGLFLSVSLQLLSSLLFSRLF